MAQWVDTEAEKSRSERMPLGGFLQKVKLLDIFRGFLMFLNLSDRKSPSSTLIAFSLEFRYDANCVDYKHKTFGNL